MTVSSLELKTIVIAGGETSFAYFFPITDISDVKVYFTIAGLDVLQTNYTVDVLDMEEGGNVVFDPAPTPGTKITITIQIGLTQDTNYVENDPFPAEAHEDALDKLTMVAQQLDETLDRCIRLPISDTLVGTTDLPSVENRKLKFLYFDQDGQIAPAEGQLIESTHTHTTFDHLTISGVFAAEYTADVGYLTAAQARFLGHVDMDVDLFVSADINSDGYITTTMDMSCVNLTASGGTFTDLTTDTLEVGNLITDTITLAGDFDVPGTLTVGDFSISSSSNLTTLNNTAASEHLCARIKLTTTDSEDLGSDPHDYLSTNYDPTYGYTISLGGAVIGKTFRATDWDYEVPTYEADYMSYFAAGESMVFSIDKNADTPSQSFSWGHGGWGDDHTPIMTLTASGVLNVDGEIQVYETPVSLEGHTHDDLYYTEDEVDATVSGIYEDITTVSGALQEQIDVLTSSGIEATVAQVGTLYFGDPTVSGTWRFATTLSGGMALQKYNGDDWDTATIWSEVV